MIVWERHPGFLRLEFTEYFAILLSTGVSIRRVLRQVLNPFANTLAVIAVF